MPHFILEHSSNIVERIDWRDLFRHLHALAVEHAPIKLEDLKSRRVAHDDFYVSDGIERKAFVFLTLALLSGRDREVLGDLGRHIISFLERTFEQSRQQLNCSVTLEIREINSSLHFKAATLPGAKPL